MKACRGMMGRGKRGRLPFLSYHHPPLTYCYLIITPSWSLCEEEQTKVVLVLACANVRKKL